jgi:hypothetical protein
MDCQARGARSGEIAKLAHFDECRSGPKAGDVRGRDEQRWLRAGQLERPGGGGDRD